MRILSFDIEDWFHILSNSPTRSEANWHQFPKRLQRNTSRILDMLAKRKQKASFFCLGWVARNYPGVVREIAAQGHEIGCHSDMHQLVHELGPTEFRADVRAAKAVLEDTVGQRISAYRAPGFSITSREARWFFETLGEEGIEVDSSVFPGRHGHGGLPDFPTSTPCLVRWSGGHIRELPMSHASCLGWPLFYSGGGYFRLMPYAVIQRFAKKQNYVMAYFHPRDFDPDQPLAPGLSVIRRFKSYVGLSSAMPKLERLIGDVSFVDLRTAVSTISWSEVPEVRF